MAISARVFSNTRRKHSLQNRLAFENDVRGFGISTHFAPLEIAAPQPLHFDFLPAVAIFGLPAEPLIKDGMLFGDIL
jgi:hypothetical protein